MPITPISDVKKANDRYRATLRSTWIASPADTSLLVDAVPDNVPTYVVVGWNTDYETLFEVTGKSGTDSSNYSLTGVTRVRGANENIPENTAVNCLNNEEFFNQYEETLSTMVDEVNDALEAVDQLTGVVALTDGATVALDASLGGTFTLSAAGNRTILAPTNPRDGQKIVIIHHASGGARTLSLTTGSAGAFLYGDGVPALTETASGDRDYIGAIYNTTLNRWVVVGYEKGFAV